jgi:hypothetical protein
MVIDRGSSGGAAPGQRVTLFRPSKSRDPHQVIGEGVIVSVQAASATIRIDSARDAIEVGDHAALHR